MVNRRLASKTLRPRYGVQRAVPARRVVGDRGRVVAGHWIAVGVERRLEARGLSQLAAGDGSGDVLAAWGLDDALAHAAPLVGHQAEMDPHAEGIAQVFPGIAPRSEPGPDFDGYWRTAQ